MPDSSPDQITAQIQLATSAPLTYGTWRDFKGLYKRAEANSATDPKLLGALIARIDSAPWPAFYQKPPAAALGAHADYVNAITVSGGRLYVSSASRGSGHFSIYQLLPGTDILKPTLLGTMSSPHANTVTVCGSYAILVSTPPNRNRYNYGQPQGPVAKHVTILNCTSPYQPVPVAEWSANVGDAVASDRRVYLSIQSETLVGVAIVNPSGQNPAFPTGTMPTGKCLAMACDGDRLYVVTDAQGMSLTSLPRPAGLQIFDIRQPDKPQLVGGVALVNAGHIGVAGSIAVVARRGSRVEKAALTVVDVSQPNAPRIVSRIDCPREVRSISVVGNAAYVIDIYNMLSVLDLSNPAQPKFTSPSSRRGWITQFTPHGDNKAATVSQAKVVILDLANRTRPGVIGADPTRETVAYMKRRTRRFLKRLERTDPDRFAVIAAEFLSRLTRPSVDPTVEWAAMDLLYGASAVYRQTRHGRGNYVVSARKLVIRRGVERGHNAWLRHPELASTLIATPNLAWQVYELAYRVLRNTKQLPSAIDPVLAARFVSSDSPLLMTVGSHRLAEVLSTKTDWQPETVADLFLAGNKRIRASVAALLPAIAKKFDWRKRFADRLVTRATANLAIQRLTRRQAASLALIAHQFGDVVPLKKLAEYRLAFLQSGRTELVDIVLAAARVKDPGGVLVWLHDLANCPVAVQERGIEALREGIRNKPFNAKQAGEMVYSRIDFVRQAGWRILQASSTPVKVLKPLLQAILDSADTLPALRTVMQSGAALSLLARAEIDIRDFARMIRERPALSNLMTTDALTAITGQLAGADTVRLIGAVSEDLWLRARPGLLDNLYHGFDRATFWKAVAEGLTGDDSDALASRLIEDTAIAATFVDTDDDSLLDIREPAFGPLHLGWAQRRADRFLRGSTLLLTAATHPSGELRDWALDRVSKQGMDFGFALRLLESELPASFEAGRTLFDAATSDDDVLKYALALCDSPTASVRGYGRYYVNAHWDALPRMQVLSSLFENSTPDIQAFTAAVLEREAARPADAASFDRDVLRMRHRSRRAKELVKARQETDRSVDIATLMALARGSVRRDSEWALSQLAQRALAGETIEGVICLELGLH